MIPLVQKYKTTRLLCGFCTIIQHVYFVGSFYDRCLRGAQERPKGLISVQNLELGIINILIIK